MSWEEEYLAIQNHFDSNWVETPYTIDNTPFRPPTAGPWIKLVVLSGESNTISIGPAARTRNTGVITVQVFTQVDTGPRTALNLADLAAKVFRHQTFDGITCRSASLERVGEKDGWYQLNVNIPFQRDD